MELGGWERPLNVSLPEASPGSANDPAWAFTVIVQAPTTYRLGTDLHYTVVLTNGNDTAVPLDPCPVYTQRLWKLELTYRLNCAPRSIPATSPASTASSSSRLRR